MNTTVTTNQTIPTNSLLQDVAISQEQMESALTVGTESLHEQTKSTIAQDWCWLLMLLAILWYVP